MGLGCSRAVRKLNIQGPITSTGNQLDMALNGRGWFQLFRAKQPDVIHPGRHFRQKCARPTGYARRIPDCPEYHAAGEYSQCSGHFGWHYLRRYGDRDVCSKPGRLRLRISRTELGEQAQGDNLYQETTSSGNPQVAAAGQPGFATIQQGYLEGSNVYLVQEITNLISARAELRNELKNHSSFGRDVPDNHEE